MDHTERKTMVRNLLISEFHGLAETTVDKLMEKVSFGQDVSDSVGAQVFEKDRWQNVNKMLIVMEIF